MVVDILARIGLVVHHEGLFAEAEILDQDRIAGHFRIAKVDRFDAPQPNVRGRMQPKADLVAHTGFLSFPDKAALGCSDPALRFGPDERKRHRCIATGAQQKPSHAVRNRRTKYLIDHDLPAAVRVLDGEDRAIWQQPDGQSGLVDDTDQTKIVLARRREDLGWRIRH
jgi:hypothetical protein